MLLIESKFISLSLSCSEVVGDHYHVKYETMRDIYLKLLSLGLRVLVYNGDTDMACNFLGCQWFVEALNQKVGMLEWIVIFAWGVGQGGGGRQTVRMRRRQRREERQDEAAWWCREQKCRRVENSVDCRKECWVWRFSLLSLKTVVCYK